jgi:signal transduction histidine kinase
MRNTRNIERIFNFFGNRTVLSNPVYRKQFFLEIGLLNFNRLRIIGYFILALSVTQLLSDTFLGEFWDTHQVSYFMYLDIFLFFVSMSLLAITHIKPPRSYIHIKTWHIISVYVFVLFELLWGSAVSIVESQSSNSLTTLLVGVFTAATVFIMRSLYFLIFLIVSLVFTFEGLFYYGTPINKIITYYGPIIFLTIVAWIVSRVLFSTRLRSFSATKEIEEARNDLDIMVKERTLELSKSNEQLLVEINERKKYEKSLEKEKKKAEEADRLKSVFLANMSHEIRTPLNGILGFSDLLKNELLAPEKKGRYLEIIRNNGQQLLKIIDDIMDISMIESNQLKINLVEFRISHLLPGALEFFTNFKRVTNKDHLVLTNDGFMGNADDTVISDPTRVQQVLYNLLSNAIKFTHTGYVRFGGRVDDGSVLIYVEDTGIGVDIEMCNTIFERFRQGEESISRSYGGTGLGLSISKGIAELLGGMIWVDLSYRKGSRFCFTIPVKKPEENQAQTEYLRTIRELEKKCLIISEDEKSYSGSILQLMKCNNITIPVLAPGNLGQLSANVLPRLIIYDVAQAGESILPHIRNTSLVSPGSEIFALIENNNKYLLEEFKRSGCGQVFFSPINYQSLMEFINEIFTAKEQV